MKKSIVPLFPDREPLAGTLPGPGPVQLLEVFETLDRQQLRVVVTRLAAQANEMLQFLPHCIIIGDSAVDQEIDAPRPCAGNLHDIRVRHSLLLSSTIGRTLPIFPENATATPRERYRPCVAGVVRGARSHSGSRPRMNGEGGSNARFAIYFMRSGTNVPQGTCA